MFPFVHRDLRFAAREKSATTKKTVSANSTAENTKHETTLMTTTTLPSTRMLAAMKTRFGRSSSNGCEKWRSWALQVGPAPNPSNIKWENIAVPVWERCLRSAIIQVQRRPAIRGGKFGAWHTLCLLSAWLLEHLHHFLYCEFFLIVFFDTCVGLISCFFIKSCFQTHREETTLVAFLLHAVIGAVACICVGPLRSSIHTRLCDIAGDGDFHALGEHSAAIRHISLPGLRQPTVCRRRSHSQQWGKEAVIR